MATYLSTHIIACMTRQTLAHLIATLQAAREVRLVRASASQMAGRLVCEFTAPDQETLVCFFTAHQLAYEWIMRAELAWGAEIGEPAQPSDAAEGAAPGDRAPRDVPNAKLPPAPLRGGASEPSAAVESQIPRTPRPGPVEAKVLHILRTLRDESAWQLIAIQHEAQPVAVLLLHDAVLAPPPLDVPMFACEADVLARNVPSPLPLLTYDQIVELIFAVERVMVW
ncbi:MAG: hypothetical protein HYZ81_23665 [Nitrospinae bacterium]|nr:hypothetical protein [Nitrospinota bacterium]